MLRLLIRMAATPDYRENLTERECQVLTAMSYGMERKDAAALLGISLETVKTRLDHARRALRAKNTTHACCEALRRGLIQ